ncbi:uncharacterized protein LOC144887801 [Branchiostoma floridae x Branchiostoma japonicum]
MGCSCSKSRKVDVLEQRRPVRNLSGRDGRQPAPTGAQHQRLTDDKGLQNRPKIEPLQGSLANLQQSGEDNLVQVEATAQEESTEATDVMVVEQERKQTCPNCEHSEDTFPELQETVTEQDDRGQAEVHEDSTGLTVQNFGRDDATIVEEKTPAPRTKKDLIPDVKVFKDLDERAVQAPEGHATIKDLVLYLIEPVTTPLEKARVLFRWVTSHIQYAVDSYVTGSFKSQSTAPVAVFQQRMSVCQGYSDLYREMCRLAKVECVTISGRAKGAGYRVGHKFGPGSNHAWNAVEIDGRWYLLDCTWAAGNTDVQKRTFEFKYNEHYFFTDPEVFVTDHHPMDNQWQLLEEPVSLEVFETQVNFETSFFKLGLLPKFLSHTISPVHTQNGEATISIKLPEPMSFSYHLYPSEGGYSQDENVLHEIVDNVALFKVTPAQKGSFMLKLFGKKRCTATSGLSFSQICSYLIDSAGPMADQLPFPRLKTSTWGPGPWLLDGFLSDVSHPRAIVTLPEGEAKITFNSVKPLEYMCNIKEGDSKWDNYALHQVNGQTASVYVRAPKPGQFILTIWAKEEDDKTYSKSVCYLLRCTKCKAHVSPYPKAFNNWTNGCRLYEPLDGRLAANRRVHFRVCCPNSVEVVVIATGKWHKLSRKADDSWEGDADTGEQGSIAQVATKKPGDKSFSIVLQYEVVGYYTLVMGCSCSKSRRVDVVEQRLPVRSLSSKDGRQPAPTGAQKRVEDVKSHQKDDKKDNEVQVEAAVHKGPTDRSSKNNDRANTTSLGQKKPEPRTEIPDVDVFKDLDKRAIEAPEGHATIKDLVLYLIETATTPLEKARVLFRWVASHIQYDVVSYVTGGPKEVTPVGVFRNRMSVCQGYADLYKDMCRFADVNCVTISGRSKGGSYKVGDKFGPDSDHAWNAVEIDGRWYLLDCTWAAGNTDLQKRTFTFEYNEHYFFTDPEVFVTDHHPMDNQWQLLKEPVSLDIFENQVRFETSFFKLGLLPKFLSHTMSPVCTQNGEAIISIKIPEPMAFMCHLYPSDGGYAQNENVLHEIVDNVAMFKVAPAQKGRFMLQIFGKLGTATGQQNQICSYMIDSAGPMTGYLPFPRLKTSTWGPGPWLLDGFISDISHPKAIITLDEGDTKLTFKATRPLHYKCDIKEDITDENIYRIYDSHAFFEVDCQTVSVYARAPKTGQFILTIWAKEETDQMYSKCINYLLKSDKCKAHVSPYPKTFNNWTNGCRLYEPLDGRLAANRRVHFRVCCPNAAEVVVIATEWHKLVRKADGSWEGDADTGEQGKILQVSAKKPGDTQYWTVLQYEVVA